MVHFRRGDVLQLGPTDFKDASELIDDEVFAQMGQRPANWQTYGRRTGAAPETVDWSQNQDREEIRRRLT